MHTCVVCVSLRRSGRMPGKETAASTVDTHTGYICISLNPRKRVHSFADSSVSDGRSYSSTHRLYITKPKGEGNACILLQAAVLLMADNLSLSHKPTHTQVPSQSTCINTKHMHKTHPFKHITTTTPNTHTHLVPGILPTTLTDQRPL